MDFSTVSQNPLVLRLWVAAYRFLVIFEAFNIKQLFLYLKDHINKPTKQSYPPFSKLGPYPAAMFKVQFLVRDLKEHMLCAKLTYFIVLSALI
jgi:hypothetical protein